MFVVSTARRAESKVRDTGAKEGAFFRLSKLICTNMVHVKCATGRQRRRQLGIARNSLTSSLSFILDQEHLSSFLDG